MSTDFPKNTFLADFLSGYKKVNFSHIRYQAMGPELIPV